MAVDRRRLGLAIHSAAMLAVLSSCAVRPACPATVEHAASGAFEGIGGDTFIGTGYAIRYVPAEDPDFRGYDLNVTRWIHGRPPGPGIFLLTDEIPGIGPGQPVLIVVEPTDNQLAYVPGPCDPLVPISEQDARGD